MQQLGPNSGLAVTGAFAAANLAPVTAPEQLLLYVADDRAAARARKSLRLLPTQRGGNVVLLAPADPSQLWGVEPMEDITSPSRIPGGSVPRAGLTQVALDCLCGNGRLPQDGEALLEYLRTNQWRWRAGSLEDLDWPDPKAITDEDKNDTSGKAARRFPK